MSGRFVQFWSSLEHDVVVNSDHVVSAEDGRREGRVRLYLTPNSGDEYLDVAGTLEEVRAKLNGEQSAPRPVAHPGAIGWELHPELPT